MIIFNSLFITCFMKRKNLIFSNIRESLTTNKVLKVLSSESQILSILIDISYSWALLTFNNFMILRMSWSVKLIKDNLKLVLYIKIEERELLFVIGLHWSLIYSLKWFPFIFKIWHNKAVIYQKRRNLITTIERFWN